MNCIQSSFIAAWPPLSATVASAPAAMWGSLFAFAQLASLALSSAAQPLFALKDTYTGDAFFTQFDFFPFGDPTHGRVNYLSQQEAVQKNLSYVSARGSFVMRADYTNKVLPTSRGRDSIRIQSQASYSDSVTVLDASHMPEGCSTWPAFWTLSAKGPWPAGGEIDIIEGINMNTRNLATLHTTPNCSMDVFLRLMTGETVSTNCDTQVNFNQGCSVNFTQPFSYGSGFNNVGGGWYVMQRTAAGGVSIWFWPRYDITVPHAVRYGEDAIQPDLTWGLPDAYFPFTQSCNADHFDAHQIVFDDTFCGDYAGANYPTSGCPGTCVDFVDNNPEAFAEAYWEVNALRVYTPQY
ncbi:concanavalin A-like lectin/glucanase domain-containing protein [Gautieria morchelliformis]|nr:concanavalin A-like lectin/glucanase domain-containing protein [Gautieria morchelliformis]